jgi:malonyl-CoA O-methyltransferase
MPTQKTPIIDRKAVSAGFDKIAAHYDQSSFLEQLLSEHLMERLEFFNLDLTHVLDLGTSNGRCARALQQHFPHAKITGVDIAPQMIAQAQRSSAAEINYLVGDVYNLPFEKNSFDLVVSNLLFPLIDDLDLAFANVQQILAPRGCFLFSTLGPDTFTELRQAWQKVDNHAHVIPFLDMHDVGDALMQAGFVEPLMDREVMTITYDTTTKLIDELKQIGARNYLLDRQRGLLGAEHYKKLLASYPRKDHHYPVTVEVIYGLAWKSEHSFSQSIHENEVHIPVELLQRIKK